MAGLWKWTPSRRPGASVTIALLLICSSAQSITLGYDSSMMGSLNILPGYTDYFHLSSSTLALQSAISWVGSMLGGLYFGFLNDWLGRKNCLYFCSIGTILAAMLQTAAQNPAMFIASRFLVGMFTSGAYICGPIYLAETLPLEWRAYGLGIFMDLYWAGGLLSAGVTYGSYTSMPSSTWAWRMPSALQGAFGLLACGIIPFLPESPRWLVCKGKTAEALLAIAATHTRSGTEVDDLTVKIVFKEIQDTLQYEKEHSRMPWKSIVTDRGMLRRLQLGFSVAIIAMVSGNNIITFYLGIMLTSAGVTDPRSQLQITMYLNIWCLAISLLGTGLLDRWGRRAVGLAGSVMMTVAMFLVAGLDKEYGGSNNKAGIYATVGAIFLFQGTFSFAWTPLATVYPPEVLNYSLRAFGMGWYTFWTNAAGLLTTMAFPYALDALGWKIYCINGGWDVLEILWVYFTWVETHGRTLEEIDEIFDGVKHSDAPDVNTIERGPAVLIGVDVETVAVQPKNDDKM